MAKLELSVNKIIKNLVINDVFLATSLNRGYTNLSAVARDLRPSLERKLGEEVSIEAIISALKRNRELSHKFDKTVMESLSKTSIQLITGVTKFVIPTERNERIMKWVYDVKLPGAIYISTSSEFTTVIVEDRNLSEFREGMNRGIVDKKSDLAVLVLKSPISILEVSGFLMSVYSKLAFSGINIEETTNSYTDAIIVVKEADASDAFVAVKELIDFAKDLN